MVVKYQIERLEADTTKYLAKFVFISTFNPQTNIANGILLI